MARKKDTPQKAALREMMSNYLKDSVKIIHSYEKIYSLIYCVML